MPKLLCLIHKHQDGPICFIFQGENMIKYTKKLTT